MARAARKPPKGCPISWLAARSLAGVCLRDKKEQRKGLGLGTASCCGSLSCHLCCPKMSC